MRKVLLAVYTAGHLTELLRIMRLLKRSGRYEPTVVFSRFYHGDLERDAALCRAEDVPSLTDRAGVGGESGPGPSHGTVSSRTYAGATRLARATLSDLPFPFTMARALARQGRELYLARRIVAGQRPDLLVLAEDSVGYETAALIKAAHEQGVPAAIVPFTVSNALEPAETYFRDPAYNLRRWSNGLVATLYPRWVFEHHGERLLRLPAGQVMAKEWWGLAPPLPWQMNSGAADVIAVESPIMEAYYRREGLPPDQLVVTGTLADDVLAENLRNARIERETLCSELGIPRDRRLVLCALPPDHFAISGPQADATDYATLVRIWIQALAAVPDCNIVVRLHPRTSFDSYKYIEEWGVRISQRDTAALVPLCDLFVASVSATIRWAIACGKPVLNYDVYRLRWTDFADAPGVLRVEDQASFVAILHKLTTDAAFFESVRARQEADAPRWGQLDGRAGERILRCFDGLVNQRGAQA